MGLVYGFCQKFKFIYRVFLGTLGLRKVFDDFLDRNLTFPDHKNIDLKKLQNLHFSKGVSPWVWSKISYFSIFQFRNIWPRKSYW